MRLPSPFTILLSLAFIFIWSGQPAGGDPVLITYSVQLVGPPTLGPPDALVRIVPASPSGMVDVFTPQDIELFNITPEAGGGSTTFSDVGHDIILTITDVASGGSFISTPLKFRLSGTINGTNWDLKDYKDTNGFYIPDFTLGGNKYRVEFKSNECVPLFLQSPMSSATQLLQISLPDQFGACCLGPGTCDMRTRDACFGLRFQGGGTDCANASCTPFNACCVFDLGCLPATAAECAQMGGIEHVQWMGCSDTCHACHPDFPPWPVPAPAPFNRPRSRYVSFGMLWPNYLMALRIRRLTPPPAVELGWLDFPDASGLSTIVDQPIFGWWSIAPWPASEGVVHVGGCQIIPGATYQIQPTQWTLCGGYQPIGPVATTVKPAGKEWGDLVGSFTGTDWPAPDGLANVNDVLAVVAYIRGTGILPHFSVVNVQAISSNDPCLNDFVNVGDLFAIVRAVGGAAYPFTTDPTQCPPCP